jgi:tRNA A37 N6-isopentenylltransferase MiaA
MKGIPHYLLSILDIEKQDFNAVEFNSKAINIVIII